jgi:hypothetical protein
MVLARLAASDHGLAARALRRHRAWREAAERGASARTQRTLRRAWQRARDDALIALSVAGMSPPSGASTCSAAAPADARPAASDTRGPEAPAPTDTLTPE